MCIFILQNIKDYINQTTNLFSGLFDFLQLWVDGRLPVWVELGGVEVQRVGLVGGVKHVRDVHKQDVPEKQTKQVGHNGALRM